VEVVCRWRSEVVVIRFSQWLSSRGQGWTHRPGARRRCAWLHHGSILKESTEYKAAARSAPDSGLASDFVAGANAAVHVTSRLRAKRRVKMKIMNFAARPFLAWHIIARHALSPSIPRA
jgi:hypothetical protein